MLRKQFKLVLLVGLGVAAGQSWAQNPTTEAKASNSSTTSVSPGQTASLEAAIWGKTAKYIYADDTELAPISTALIQNVRSGSIAEFEQSLEDAKKLAASQKIGVENLSTFQNNVYNSLKDKKAFALVRAIVAKLSNNKKRKDDKARMQQLALLEQQLDSLTTGKIDGKSTYTSQGADGRITNQNANDVSTRPETDIIAAPLPGAPVALADGGAPGWVSWVALGLSILSFAGMVQLFRKLNRVENVASLVLPTSSPERSSRQGSKPDSSVSWDEMRKFVERQMDERLNPTAAPAATPVAKATAKPAPKVPASSAPALEPDDFESFLAPLPAPAPRQRIQYANEAPFNNSFPARALSDQPGTYSMFAITSSEQQPDQGIFDVTGNLANHVRDHRSVLEPVCEYIGNYPLGSESRVVTVEPGRVRRRGDDWEVVQRAKVRFE